MHRCFLASSQGGKAQKCSVTEFKAKWEKYVSLEQASTKKNDCFIIPNDMACFRAFLHHIECAHFFNATQLTNNTISALSASSKKRTHLSYVTKSVIWGFGTDKLLSFRRYLEK